MKTVTIEYGFGNSRTLQVPDGTTVGQLLSDTNLQAQLGFGASVDGLIDGVRQESDCVVEDGEKIVVQTRANTKGF